MLKDMRVVQKEYKMVNRVDRWCIFLFLGGFKCMELNAVEKWLNVINEVPDIKFFSINKPSIINTNKIELPLEG